MSNLRDTLLNLAKGLSEENYDVSVAQYRFWLNVGIAHGHINDQLQVANDAGWILRWDVLKPEQGKFIHPAARLYARFIRDIEAGEKMSEQVLGLKQKCAKRVDNFFEDNLSIIRSGNQQEKTCFLALTNCIASWANLGYVEEVALLDQILQSLTSSPKLHDYQADALIVLFTLAGGTFEAYVDPSVVDRCFELLKGYGARGKMVLVSVRSLKG